MMGVSENRIIMLRAVEKKNCPNYSKCLVHAAKIDSVAVPCNNCLDKTPPMDFNRAKFKKEVRQEPTTIEILLFKFPNFDNSWSIEIQLRWFDAFKDLITKTENIA